MRFLLNENVISGKAICKLIRRSSTKEIVSYSFRLLHSNNSKSGMNETSVPLPALSDTFSLIDSAPLVH